MTTQIQIAVARVAGSNPAEMIRQFSHLAKTTQVELEILTWVARADIIICTIARNWHLILASLIIGIVAGRWLYKCLGR